MTYIIPYFYTYVAKGFLLMFFFFGVIATFIYFWILFIYFVIYCYMMEMSKRMLFVIYLIYCFFVSYSTCVECWDRDFETSVHGISLPQDFDFCHNEDSVVVNYYSCHIAHVRLPIRRIMKTFPSVKIVNWASDSKCYVELKEVEIQVRGYIEGEYRLKLK